jgi:hypothetical protein
MLLVGLQGQQAQQPRPADQDRPGARPSATGVGIDGTWKVIYCEENGRAKEGDKDVSVNVQGNSVSFKGGDARMQAMRLEFGPQNSVRVVSDPAARPGGNPQNPATGRVDADAARVGTMPTRGIYIPSQQFLCIALTDASAGTVPEARPGQATDPARAKPGTVNLQPATNGKPALVLILQRDGANARPGQ